MIYNHIYRRLLDIDHRINSAFESASSIVENMPNQLNDGDRNWYTFVDEFIFSENERKVQDINFNISGDADFVAKRFGLYLRKRSTEGGLAQGISPSGVLGAIPFNFSASPNFENQSAIDCIFTLTESYQDKGVPRVREYQNIPIPASLAFSSMNIAVGSPSAMIFDVDWHLERHSVVQCKVTLTSALSTGTDEEPDELKIIGVLSGHKKTREFA